MDRTEGLLLVVTESESSSHLPTEGFVFVWNVFNSLAVKQGRFEFSHEKCFNIATACVCGQRGKCRRHKRGGRGVWAMESNLSLPRVSLFQKVRRAVIRMRFAHCPICFDDGFVQNDDTFYI
jgi:hypothetical protein